MPTAFQVMLRCHLSFLGGHAYSLHFKNEETNSEKGFDLSIRTAHGRVGTWIHIWESVQPSSLSSTQLHPRLWVLQSQIQRKNKRLNSLCWKYRTKPFLHFYLKIFICYLFTYLNCVCLSVEECYVPVYDAVMLGCVCMCVFWGQRQTSGIVPLGAPYLVFWDRILCCGP